MARVRHGLELRVLGGVGLGFAGWQIGIALHRGLDLAQEREWALPLAATGAVLGLLFTPRVLYRSFTIVLASLKGIPITSLFVGTVGLALGLALAALVTVPLSYLPGGNTVPIVAAVVLGAVGMAVAVDREQDLVQLFHLGTPQSRAKALAAADSIQQVVLDTSAIIDGRVAEIHQAGFLPAVLVIPRFVLDELRHIADSSDALRRNRGRRGLEILNRLRRESNGTVQVLDIDLAQGQEVDARLVQVAKQVGAPILTTDFNLNKVAELQGVKVLNINELANAMKPTVLPGELMQVRIIQSGKEVGQGVGFLDDGTMVVVEGGKRFINTEQEVQVTRTLQTAAGRIIFAQPRDGAGNGQ